MVKQTDPKKLKQYLKYASELESSVYRQEETILAANRALRLKEPQKEYIREPVEPVKIASNITKPKYLDWSTEAMENDIRNKAIRDNKEPLVYCILGAVVAVACVVCCFFDFDLILLVLSLACGWLAYFFACCVSSGYKGVEYTIASEKERIADYNKKISGANERYQKELKLYKKTKAKVEKSYKSQLAIAKNNYNVAQNAIEQMNEPLKKTKQALTQLYSADWIHPKYRNMVAMCTIYEYFDTGRCTTLTGPDGAYNLYEAELRQNLIINKLDSIISQLEAIKSNQYVLYCELVETNKMVKRIASGVDDIVKTTHAIVDSAETTAACAQITASCAQTTAKNTEALKYIALISA